MCVGKLSYASVVYGLASDVAYPVKISGTSCANMTAVLAKNETRFQWGFYPHFNAWLHTGMFPSGRLRVSAQMPSDADKRHQVVLNPLTNTLSDYYEEEGSMPSVDPIDSGWYRATSPDGSHPDPTVAIYAYTGDQTIFTSQVRPDVLRCVENATGVTTTITSSMGGFMSLRAFNN
jgi:hypothetical protein